MTVIGILFLFICTKSSAYFVKEASRIGIYHGSPTDITKVPYMALYRPRNESHHCGAAIVHEKFLVTAAHCYKTCDADKYVTVGTSKIHGADNYEIEETFVHPKYVHDDVIFKPDYDVAVIKLKKKLTFGDRVRPIAMAQKDFVIEDGALVTAMGFGMTEDGRESPDLLTVDVPYVKQTKCKKEYKGTEYTITDRMLCAGDEDEGSCNFDSGSPLVYNNVFVGITSGGKACGSSKWPVIYSRVSALRSFIDSIVGKK